MIVAKALTIAPYGDAIPVSVAVQMPCGGLGIEGEGEEPADLADLIGLHEQHEGLDAAIKVAMHHVGGADPDFLVTAVFEAVRT